MSVGQRFPSEIFTIPKDGDADPVLAVLAIACVAEVDWRAMHDLEWVPYSFEEDMIFVLPTSAPLRLVSASG